MTPNSTASKKGGLAIIAIVVLGVLVLFDTVMASGTPIKQLVTFPQGVLYSILVYLPLLALALTVLIRSRKK